MQRDPNDNVERVREGNDIAAVVGGYVRLRKAGKNFKGLCPFHKEKTPSFIVSPDRQTYHCFGCSKGGDVFRFVMEMDGVGFAEALRTLAARAGIQLESTWDQAKHGEREEWFRVLMFARSYFQMKLRSPEGEGVRRYLNDRGINDQTVEEFAIGWAPDEWRRLRELAHRKGISDSALVETGLLIPKEGKTPYDRFRGRLMFPIEDTSSRTIGFGGRILGDGEPKYLNSPETALFRKGEALYGLSHTKGEIHRNGRAVLVEGYTDLLALWQHGIRTGVAPLGTALTPAQARLIGNHADRVVLLFDGDEAGMRATLRSLAVLSGEGITAQVATLPRGVDPDELLRDKGPDELLSRLDSAEGLVPFVLRFPFGGGREEAIRSLIEVFASVKDEIRLNLFLQDAQKRTGIAEEVLYREIRSLRRSEAVKPMKGVLHAPGPRKRLLDAQRGIAYLGFENPDLLPVIRKAVQPGDVQDIPARKLLKALYECMESGVEPSQTVLTLTGVDEAFARLRIESTDWEDPVTVLHDYIACVRGEAIEQRSRSLHEELRDAEERNDSEACSRLLDERKRLAAQRRRIAYAVRGDSDGAEIVAGERSESPE